jgi:anti-sigma factor ChrR (cupin superfamily)
MHPQDGDLNLYALGRLTPRQASKLTSHLAGCEVCHHKLSHVKGLGQPPAFRERRGAARTPANDRASMRVLTTQPSGRVNVRILEMSKGGLKLLAPGSLHVGTSVQIRLKHTIALGEVRHCRPAGVAFHVGVLIQDVFPLSQTADESRDQATMVGAFAED